MTVASTDLRVVATQIVGLLTDENTSLEQRVELVHTLLANALTATAPLNPAQRAALDADPGVQAALARLDADEEYVLAGPDGSPGDAMLEPKPGTTERPVDEQRLAELGF
ncbi:MAG: hypothetical protein ACLFVO_08180 [Chloroflexaceae bacterium]